MHIKKVTFCYMKDYFTIDYTDKGANIPQIQVMASIIKDMVNEQLNIDNKELLCFLPLPKEFDSWESLNDFCKSKKGIHCFKIKSELFGTTTYIIDNKETVLPNHVIYLYLFALQNLFKKLEKIDLRKVMTGEMIDLTSSLVDTFIIINNEMGNYFFNLYYNNEDFDYKAKYRPCTINLDWLRDLKGFGCLIASEIPEVNKKQFEIVYKVRMQELACQCRYLSFWACLLQIISCTSLPKAVHYSFCSLAHCLLKNIDSAYVHHIIVEQTPLNDKVVVSKRGSNDNTTRIKVYFTFENGMPLVARLDLPHKGIPYLHINIESEQGELSGLNHCLLSIKPYENNILKPLEEALMTFNHSAIIFDKAISDNDRMMLHKVKVERALFGVTSIVWGKLLLDQICREENKGYNWDEIQKKHLSQEAQNYIEECRDVLKKEVALQGLNPEEINDIDTFELVFISLVN